MPILCALVGATGVGKTNLSLALAQEFHAEIISMDSRQIYRGFCIGTAQPTEGELKKVKHHLVDFLSPTENFSVGEFMRNVKELLAKNPTTPYILVGGTGMYLQALTEGIAEIPQVSSEVRETAEKFLQENGILALYEKVKEIDSESAMKILPQDKQRLLRAYEVTLQTGRKFSEVRKERCGGIGKIPTFWLNRSREILYKRIDERVQKMVELGWKNEVENLVATVPENAPAWQSLGYREWVECLRGKISEAEVIACVQQGTRHYAKRQLTWFRHQTESSEINLDAGFENCFATICDSFNSICAGN